MIKLFKKKKIVAIKKCNCVYKPDKRIRVKYDGYLSDSSMLIGKFDEIRIRTHKCIFCGNRDKEPMVLWDFYLNSIRVKLETMSPDVYSLNGDEIDIFDLYKLADKELR